MLIEKAEVNAEFENISKELLIKINLSGIITGISSNCYNILGYERSQMLGSNMDHYFIGEFEHLLIDGINNLELVVRNTAGIEKVYDATIYSDNKVGLKISLIDNNQYKEIEKWEKNFRNILENAKDMVYLYEIIPEKKFIYINHTIQDMIGMSESPSMGPFDIAHPDDLHIQYEKINSLTNFDNPMQMRLKNSEGEYIWYEDNVIPFYNSEGDLQAISGFCRNIQERKELELKLEEIGLRDTLTGLFNSNYYHMQETRLNDLDDNSIGLIMCDLDDLKITNDSYGHTFGDKSLFNFAKILERNFSEDVVIARIGGDEFIILLENVTKEEIRNKYFGLLQSLKDFNKCNKMLPLKASIGWSYSLTSLGMMETVFKKADIMMYKNKLHKR